MKIINDALILETKESETSKLIILKGRPYLGEVIDKLPAGIIDKSETGIGATTLELTSRRHSIVVVPLKSIAASKAQKHSHCMYLGGAIGEFASPTEVEILKYHNKVDGYKKFLVVADSLPKLINVIGQDAVKGYFFLIDEVDSFQLDGHYRESLENCLDYYKLVNSNRRALVSGTLMKFSDPDLANETKYTFKYENSKTRTINANFSENVVGASIEHIASVYNKDRKNKIVVAYNYVAACKAIAEKLVQDFEVNAEDIKILCSAKSQQNAGHYYGELSDGFLPGKINFITSAYFVGVDINEQFHLSCISNAKFRFTLLSLNRLKQIAGRCRKGSLLSDYIFYNTTNLQPEDRISKRELIEIAEAKIGALRCISLNFQYSPILTKQTQRIRELIIGDKEVLHFNLVREDIHTKNVISYFNIDACLENMGTTKMLYSGIQNLPFQLKKIGHRVFEDIVESSISVSNKASDYSTEKDKQIELAIDSLLKLSNNKDFEKNIDKLIYVSNSTHQTEFLKRYKELYKYFFTEAELLEKLKELSNKNVKAYKTVLESYKFNYDKSKTKKLVTDAFPIGSKHTDREVHTKLNQVYADANLTTFIKSPRKAIEILNKYFDVKRNRKHDSDTLHEILKPRVEVELEGLFIKSARPIPPEEAEAFKNATYFTKIDHK